jgi:hypothetical protein
MAVHRQDRGDARLYPLFSSFLTVLIYHVIVVAGLMVGLGTAVVRPGRIESMHGIAMHGKKRLWGETRRRYCCHVMLAFGVLCKGLTYY